MTEAELNKFANQIEVMEQLVSSRNVEQLEIENSKFHAMIRQATKNPMIFKMVENVASFDESFRKSALKETVEIDEGFKEHKLIFEAIQLHNPEEAEKRMKSHIFRTAKSVLEKSGKETVFIKQNK